MEVLSAQRLETAMRQGRVYRRAELTRLSRAVDRDLQQLVSSGRVLKVGPGLYCRPESSEFGPVPPSDKALVAAFLKEDRFLLISPADFNSLGLGLTQLYPYTVVLNRKRYGEFVLSGRRYRFVRPLEVPQKLTKEVLFMELLARRNKLSETVSDDLLRNQIRKLDGKKLKLAVNANCGATKYVDAINNDSPMD